MNRTPLHTGTASGSRLRTQGTARQGHRPGTGRRTGQDVRSAPRRQEFALPVTRTEALPAVWTVAEPEVGGMSPGRQAGPDAGRVPRDR